MNNSAYRISIILFLCIIFISLLISCSTKQKDNLQTNHIIQQKINDIDSLIFLSSQVQDSFKNLSKEYAEKALIFSKSILYLKGEGEASLHLGNLYLYSNQFPTSLKFLFRALNISNQLNDITLKTNAYVKICENFIKLQRTEKAKFYFQKYYIIATKNKDTSNIIEALRRESDIYKLEGESEKELSSLYRALWFSNAKNDYRRIARINKHIGNYFLSIRNYANAEYYYRKAFNVSVENNFLIDMGTIYSLIAYIYSLEGNFEISLSYNWMALKIRQNNNQEDQVASSLINIGKCLMQMNKSDSSLIYFRKGLDIADKLNIDVLQEAGNKYIYELYLQKKDWKNALNYYRSYVNAKDSVSLEQKRQESALIEANQTIEENMKKSDLLEAENQVQKTKIKYNRIQIIFLGIIIVIIILALYYTYRQYIRNKKSKIALQQLNKKLDIEIEERNQAEALLRKSEALHSFLTNNSLDVITRIDNKNKFVYISPSCINIFGYDQQEMMELENVNALIDPPSLEPMRTSFQDMIRSKEPAKLTYRNRKKDGSLFWAESHVNPFFNEESGELTEMISVIRDISERIAYEEALKESNRQKELLMREIHHRAKNNFAILISLLSIQKFQTQNRELADILSELQARIRTMVLIHEQLYKSNSVDIVSFGQYILSLANIISNAFRKEGITLHSEISECRLNIEIALPLGLVVNELLTNSYKYAFTGRNKGNIHVKLAQLLHGGDDGNYKWELIIEDDGIGLPESFSLDEPSSMGSQIIQALVDQIHGRIEIAGKNGASFRILFPGTESN
jgi:PAS domain S-box-containing protein